MTYRRIQARGDRIHDPVVLGGLIMVDFVVAPDSRLEGRPPLIGSMTANTYSREDASCPNRTTASAVPPILTESRSAPVANSGSMPFSTPLGRSRLGDARLHDDVPVKASSSDRPHVREPGDVPRQATDGIVRTPLLCGTCPRNPTANFFGLARLFSSVPPLSS